MQVGYIAPVSCVAAVTVWMLSDRYHGKYLWNKQCRISSDGIFLIVDALSQLSKHVHSPP